MKKINLREAKTNFSKLVERAIQGEEVIICKAGNPVVRLVPIHRKKKTRRPGIWAGRVTIEEDFDVVPCALLRKFTCY